MTSSPLRILYCGLGIMGGNIARNILQKGNFAQVAVWNRSASKAEPLIALGAKLAASPKEGAQDADIIFTNLSDSPDVQDVILREGDGILAGCHEGCIIIDNSTIKPKVAQFIAEECRKRKNVHFIDCPVSGAEPAAIAGTCTAMVGADDEQALERAMPVLKTFCKAITHIGPSGAGQIAKCANQIMVAAQMTAEAELLVYAQKSGVDPMKVVEALRHGGAACFTLDHKPQRIMAGNRSPGFKIDHQLKDLKIVMESAAENQVSLPVTSFNMNLYQSSVAMGEGDLDNSAVLGVLERMNNCQVGPNYRSTKEEEKK